MSNLTDKWYAFVMYRDLHQILVNIPVPSGSEPDADALEHSACLVLQRMDGSLTKLSLEHYTFVKMFQGSEEFDKWYEEKYRPAGIGTEAALATASTSEECIEALMGSPNANMDMDAQVDELIAQLTGDKDTSKLN